MLSSAPVTLRFLSRLPVPGGARVDEPRDIHAAWFPPVGFVIGALVATLDLCAARLAWEVRDVLVIVTGIALSGALHFDALMDAADGLSVARAESQSVTHASVHTSAGIASGLLAGCVAWLGLSTLHGDLRWLWLICAPVFGRSAIVVGYRALPPGPDVGAVTRSLAKSAHSWTAGLSLVICAGLMFALLGGVAVFAFLASAAAALLAIRIFQEHKGGVGGDHFGALGVIGECSVLIVAAFYTTALRA
ncbi:MAG: adenosylcobinamide-GDP ribazoletransferase [Chloroflexota bacterium]